MSKHTTSGGIRLTNKSDVFTVTTLDATVYGGNGRDKITGGSGNDWLYGQNGKDQLDGAAGDDWLYGGNGKDLLGGGDGNDGLFGGNGRDKLQGGDGDDTLNGGKGADHLAGGKGDDTYVVNHVGDVVLELADEGIDLVQAAANFALSANVENLTLIGKGNFSGTGNSGDNTIIGNDGANTLSGGLGNDTIDLTAGGNDTNVVTSMLDGHDVVDGFDADPTDGQDKVDLDALFDSLGVGTSDRAGRVTETSVNAGADTLISIDANGDTSVDVTILLKGVILANVDEVNDILLGSS